MYNFKFIFMSGSSECFVAKFFWFVAQSEISRVFYGNFKEAYGKCFSQKFNDDYVLLSTFFKTAFQITFLRLFIQALFLLLSFSNKVLWKLISESFLKFFSLVCFYSLFFQLTTFYLWECFCESTKHSNKPHIISFHAPQAN